ncbi:MAG: tetratricopeptide repeat-containing sensor histidine kinase [Chloroherpetonaceae bacterium]|nr:tetratricopeptide repeat-containing sensor histidine kinase [Chloroherpetonaceae bacterium]
MTVIPEQLSKLRTRFDTLRANPSSNPFEVLEAANDFAWELRMTDAKQALLLGSETQMQASDFVTPEAEEGLIDFITRKKYILSRAQLIVGECHWRLSDYVNAISNLQNALIELEAIGDVLESRNFVAQALNGLAIVYERFGEYQKALQNHQQSLSIRRSMLDRIGEASSLMGIGIVHQYLGDYATSLEYLHRSLKLRQEITDRYGEASSYNQLGAVYSKINDISKAVDCFHKSLFIRQELKDYLGEATVLSNLGDAYLKLTETEQALECYQKSLKIKRDSGDQRAEAMALIGIGKVYFSINEEDKAISFYLQAYAISNLISEPRLQAETLFEIARASSLLPKEKIKDETENNTLIIDCLQKSLSIAEQLGAKNLIYPIYLQLAKISEKVGETTTALSYYKLYNVAREEVFNLETEERIRRIRILNEIEKKEREAAFERREAEIYRRRNADLEHTLAEAERQRHIAQEANAIKTELLAIAAHDMKNPLQSILGFTEFLLEETSRDSAAHEYLTIIRQSANGMFQLISDLLKTASLESGRIKLRKDRFNLYSTVFFIIESYKSTAYRKLQSLYFDSPEVIMMTGDEDRVREAVENLISNAIKYSPQGKTIFIKIEILITQLIISVKDEGLGLTDDDKEKLFGQFQRLSARPTGGEPSTGLGLALTKQIIELHGGSVWADSPGKNLGSTFFIKLPLKSDYTETSL